MTPSSSSAASAGTSFAASDNPTNPVSIFLGTIPVAVYCYHAHNNDNQSVMASLAAAVATIIAIEAVPELVRRYIMRRSSMSTTTVPSSPGSVMTSLLSASTASSQQQRDDLVGVWIRAAYTAGWVWNDHAEQFSRRPSTTAVPSPSFSSGMASASATTVASQQQRGWWAQMQPSAAEEEEEEEDQAARASLMERGFDPDDLTKISPTAQSRTPMTWYCKQGNIPMVRYLIARGVDCRRADRSGGFPMYMAAMEGHLELVQFLSHYDGAHEDIRRLTTRNQVPRTCYSPLSIALHRNHFHVAYWLLLNFGWLPRWFGRNDGGIIVQERGRGWIDYYVDNGVIHDATMRSDLSPTYRNGRSRQWGSDKRETVHAWAQDIVTNYDNVVTLLLTGTFASASTSSLIVFKGTPGILELITHYVAYTPQQVRTPRQLLVLLPAFIDDTPFVEETEEERTRRRRQYRSRTPPRRRRRRQ